MLVRIGNVFEFPANLFWSDNVPNYGTLMAGRDSSMSGPTDHANRWFRIGFDAGAGPNDLGVRSRILEMGGIDPSNNGTVGKPPWTNVSAKGTWNGSPIKYINQTYPGLIGATVDGQGDVYIDESHVAAATKNGQYGSYVKVTTQPTTLGGGGTGAYIMSGAAQTTGTVGSAKRAYELTVLPDGRFFYALNKHESAGQDSPHTGVIAAGPGLWPPVFGKPSDNGLPDGLYLLSVDPHDASPEDAALDADGDGVPDVIVPASKAYKMLVMKAQHGDEGAIEAANALSIDIPDAGGATGLFQRLHGIF